MNESINNEIRKKVGQNLKRLIQEKEHEIALRNLDAITGKDHSWLGKIFRGEQNITIDSLSEILQLFKIQPKDVFNFTVKFPKEE